MQKRGAALCDSFLTNGPMSQRPAPETMIPCPVQARFRPFGCFTSRMLVLAATMAFTVPHAGAQESPAAPQDAWKLRQALGLPDGVRVEGSVRPRYEALANPFVADRPDDDEFLGLQTLLRAEVDIGQGTALTLGGELLDSRFIAGNETGGAAGEINTLEPAQAYLAWRPHDVLMNGAQLDLTAGRFTMDIGSRRLTARANYRSILASFDGVRVVWTTKDRLVITLAYVAPVTREPLDAISTLDNEVALDAQLDSARLTVAHVDALLPGELRGELYVFDFDENDNRNAATRNRDLTTIGGRLRRLPARGKIDFDLEFARQTGAQHATTSPLDVTPLDHKAGMAHAEAGYSIDAPGSPRVSLHYDFASGDASPSDGRSGRFDPLFGDRSFELGPTSTFGFIARTNFSSPGLRLEVKPDGASDAYVMLRHVALDRAQDSFANSGVRDPVGVSGKDVGVQLEGRYRHWLVKDSLRLTLGAAVVFEGDFLKTAPSATGMGNPVYGYSELTWTF